MIKNLDLSIFGFIHEFWTILTTNMMYTRSQNYTNVMVGAQHRIQTFEIVTVVVLGANMVKWTKKML